MASCTKHASEVCTNFFKKKMEISPYFFIWNIKTSFSTYKCFDRCIGFRLLKMSTYIFLDIETRLCLGERSSMAGIGSVMVSSASSRSLFNCGSTTFPRSGLSFLLSSVHLTANWATDKASSLGQPGTDESSISRNVPFSMAI